MISALTVRPVAFLEQAKMPVITLPDGSKREYAQALTVAEVAASIGAGLAKAALAGRVDGTLVDTSFLIERDAQLAIVTDKEADGLDIIRHSTAHLLAYAVKELFPDAQVTIGPVIENGFYYDFAYKRPFTPEDLVAIEKRMAELAKKDFPVTREVWSRDEAVEFFKSIGEHYKAEIIAAIPAGRGRFALSRGRLHRPVPRPARAVHRQAQGVQADEGGRRLLARRLEERDAAAHLRHGLGEEGRAGRLPAHAGRGREARPPQARQAARPVPSAGRGAGHGVLAPARAGRSGSRSSSTCAASIATTAIRKCAARRSSTAACGRSPGHWENYKDNMFTTESEKRDYAIKPMNCPGHVQIFNTGLRSYRDLPLRYGEFGSCHRNEPSGALHGLMRVRGFTQDDGHIFCTEDQIQSEVMAFNELLRKVYADFGFHDIVRQAGATRPEKRVGADEVWDKAEEALREALQRLGPGMGRAAGRGRLLRPEDRVPPQGCHRPLLAVRHDAGGLLHARAPRRRICRRGQQPPHAGHAAPRHPRLAGALHRHPDRESRRALSRCGWRRCRWW